MNTCKTLGLALTAIVSCGLLGLGGLGSAEPDAAKAPLVIINSTGKEQKLKTWKFVVGTRHLPWVAPAKGDKEVKKDDDKKDGDKEVKKDDDKKDGARKNGKLKAKPVESGPEALVFREENSTTFADGIVTYVPLEYIRSINYDNEEKTVSVRVATGEKEDATVELKGTTKFIGINKLTIEAEADLGDLGVAEVKFQGGMSKGGIRAVIFPGAKAAPAPAGRPAAVTANEKDAEKGAHKATDLLAYYRAPDGSIRLEPFLMFKKSLKIDLAKVKALRLLDEKELEFQVTLKDGQEVTLTLLKTIKIDDKPAVLQGLLGKAPAGYKFFPVHTLAEVEFDVAAEKPKD